ncbi:MAG: hypothetical protein ACR65W_14485, partial [Methylocystis sp.]|uniref:hypothetical protein n=1 Tax=Methylocystis sp. TaxID=1911079 RepID=UPI003DA50D67
NPQPRLFPPRSSEIVSIIDSGHDPRATRTTIAAVSPNRQTALGGGLRKTGQITRMKANAGADGWITPSELNPIPPGAIITLRAEFSPPQGLSAKDFMLEWGIISLTALYDGEEYKATFGEPEMSKIFEGFGINPLGPHVSRKR